MASTARPLILERAVLATVAALDAFAYAPTGREAWRWLFAVDPRTANPTDGGRSFGLPLPVRPEDVTQALTALTAQRRLVRSGDRFFLPGREALTERHGECASSAPRKWRRVRRAAEFLRLVPFVEFVGVCNTLAYDNARPESDMDVFIVVRDGHLWTSRALVTAVVHALGLRRHDDKIRDRVCLSFYVTQSALDLSPLTLKPVDPELALWVAQMVPVLDRHGTFAAFRRANAWVERILPNAFAEARSDRRVRWSGPLALAQNLYELFLLNPLIGPAVESFARGRQMKRMDRNWWSRSKSGGTDVVISDLVLKFHEADRRAIHRDAIAERVSRVLQ
jgi:hypothetical protein